MLTLLPAISSSASFSSPLTLPKLQFKFLPPLLSVHCRAARPLQQQPQQQKQRSKPQKGASPAKSRPPRRRGTANPEKPPVEVLPNPRGSSGLSSPLPKPPAGFVLDASGKVLLVSSKRVATIVDPSNNLPLECLIRRVFESSQGDECMLLWPLDMPIQILKSGNFDGWSSISDKEIEEVIPAASYALAKAQMHLVVSGFCLTARGGFCYSEGDIFDFHTGHPEDTEGVTQEGVEITCFDLDGSHYMIYTPVDPLLFVAVKNQDGILHIADDDLYEDPAVIAAVDEETEFNALAEEEEALFQSVTGER